MRRRLTNRSNLLLRIEFPLRLGAEDIQSVAPPQVTEASWVASFLGVTNSSVDLSKMRKVRADPDKKLLFAQGGALISDLDEAAAEYGLATGSFPHRCI